MSDINVMQAELRERVGKGSARATRRAGRVPAVVYGLGQAPTSISLPFNILQREVNTGRFENTIFELEIGKETERVIPRDVQLDLITDFPIHVDFLRISRDTKVTVSVIANFINEGDCAGLSRGGVLNVVRHDIELLCPADSIPEQIEIDLAGLDIGDSVHISDVNLPEGVEPTITDRDFTIATIAAPSGGADDEEEAEVAEEGEEGAEEAAAEEGDSEE
jgi:large subunit ribosomal protein L25